jgi:trehalose-6-phosphate synthase
MSDRLGYDEQGKKKVFRDSLVDNAVELCRLLQTLNVTQDPKLERARQQLESILIGVDADELRKDGARDEIKAKVDSALGAWF